MTVGESGAPHTEHDLLTFEKGQREDDSPAHQILDIANKGLGHRGVTAVVDTKRWPR
jgi:hypothetical protein